MKRLIDIKSFENSIIEQEQKDFWINIVDITMLVLSLTALIYTFVFNDITLLKVIVGSLLITAIIYLGYLYRNTQSSSIVIDLDSTISKLVLINDKNENEMEWSVEGKTALVIGKGSSVHEVEIDLSNTEYDALIRPEHAVLNCVSGVWYLEDIEARDEVGIKKVNKNIKEKLKYDIPEKLHVGDIIYIGNARILVQ